MEITCLRCNNKMTKSRASSLSGKLTLIKEPIKYFSTKESSVVIPYVCSQCGVVEWYVEEPENFSERT